LGGCILDMEYVNLKGGKEGGKYVTQNTMNCAEDQGKKAMNWGMMERGNNDIQGKRREED